MSVIAVIDYGMSNLRSVAKALEHVAAPGQRVRVAQTGADIRAADRVVFPGQGAIGDCIKQLQQRALAEAVREAAASKPFLGICLGLQSLMDFSEEGGGTEGFGICPGKVVRFPLKARDPDTDARLKIPHMGWNQVIQTRAHPLWRGIESGTRFYFVHSYYVVPGQQSVVAGTAHYGFDFTCALAYENVFATQFHPEKSQQPGLQLLANFTQWDGVD